MSRQRRLMAFGFLVIAAAVGLITWKPWRQPPPVPVDVPNLNVLNPANLVTLSVVKSSGGSGRMTMTGHYGNTFDRAVFNMPPGEGRYLRRVPGPYVFETVTVERDGKTHRQELKLTIPAGESRQITVHADDTVEVGPPS